ncbi:MAG: T9SS type A sorting domain-containing protein [Ignavibacteria bacterium]|nr:T9SS type A sorting domain-containing protein [Ignavibacteria bacterium]
MKKKLLLLVFLIVSLVVTGLNIIPENPKQSQQTSSQGNRPNVFLIGAIQMEGDPNFNIKCDELKFNVWHNYVAIFDMITINGKTRPVPNGWYTFSGNSCKKDRLQANVSDYADAINSVISDIKNKGYWSFMERPKIEYLIRGQQSVYQCENVSNITSEKFYCFDGTETGIDIQDTEDGVNFMVKKCEPGVNPANSYVVYNVHSKYEQTACKGANELYKDNQYYWFVKPRIRIPQGLPDGIDVCQIEVHSFDGAPVLTKIIKSENFKQNDIYNGKYKEEFNFFPSEPNALRVDGEDLKPSDCDHSDAGSLFDIRVRWLGQCTMWIDYVKMESDVAETMFKSAPFNSDPWITGEANLIGATDGAYRFWVEEPDYNCLPSVKYVQDKMINNPVPNPNPTAKLLMNDYSCYQAPWGTNVTDYDAYKAKYNSMNMSEIVSMCFFFKLRDSISNELQTVPYDSINGLLGNPVPKSEYEIAMQNKYDRDLIAWQKKYAIHYAKDYPEKPFYFGVTAILNFYPPASLGFGYQGAREPTNQEIETIANIMVTYGVKGIMYHCYGGFGNLPQTDPKASYGRGLTNPPGNGNPNITKRETNVYGQQKWNAIKAYNEKLTKWGPYLMEFNNGLSNSYRYHRVMPENSIDERTALLATYIKHINTYTNGDPVICPEGNNNNDGMDTQDKTYLQVGIFEKSAADLEKYFMIVNRRCNPGTDACSGYRQVKVQLGGAENRLDNFNNWKVVNLLNDSTVAVLDKRVSNQIDLGWFNAGEGKLFKLTPVMIDGGTLVADEYINTNLACNGMIYGGGYNITVNQGKTVTFGTNAGIEMNGGCFVCGVNADNAEEVTLQGKNNENVWKGITLIRCDSIGIYNTNISNVISNDTAKACSIINTNKVHFRRNTINTNSNSGGIQGVYNNFSDAPIIFNIRECTFNMNQSGYSAVNIISNASVTFPLVAEWCIFNAGNDTSNAIMLTGVTGGAIKNCYFNNFNKSVVLLSSAIDLYGNKILGNDNSQGIQCLSGSSASLSPTSGLYLGGNNYIRNYGSNASNIYSENSNFNINGGQNNFDLNDIDNSRHLTGTFSGMEQLSVSPARNCFHKDSVTNIDALHSVVWYADQSTYVNFIFTPYSCKLTPPQDFALFNSYGYQDTVYRTSGGEGSGFNPDKISNIEENVYKSLKDTININLRKRNYAVVEEKAKSLLNQFPDSLESAGMVQKLYMASLSPDNNGNRIGTLKTYLENLITSNQQNPNLTKRAFFYIQKCKVKLGQYQSALDGFQYIMTQNPYTYEGLVASWDYAATYLLMGQGGSLSGDVELTTEELSTPADTLLNRMARNDTKIKNTDKQKTKVFYEKIKTAAKDDRTKQEEKVKQFEKTLESSVNEISKSKAKTELATMKQIKESVKIKKPNTVKTHVAIMNDDIKKIFGIGKGSGIVKENTLIPKTFELHQNYPNPFNPVTKIAFDMPQDGKVKLMIYDILGREIKTLVNNEFRSAGKYISEFDGSGFASGVYFYRLLVSGGKEFTAVKKMLLIK